MKLLFKSTLRFWVIVIFLAYCMGCESRQYVAHTEISKYSRVKVSRGLQKKLPLIVGVKKIDIYGDIDHSIIDRQSAGLTNNFIKNLRRLDLFADVINLDGLTSHTEKIDLAFEPEITYEIRRTVQWGYLPIGLLTGLLFMPTPHSVKCNLLITAWSPQNRIIREFFVNVEKKDTAISPRARAADCVPPLLTKCTDEAFEKIFHKIASSYNALASLVEKESKTPPAELTFETKRTKPSLVEIDDAPERNVKCKDGYAIVVGIEKYRDLPQVEFAKRDAQAVKNYLIKTMGFPEANIVTLLNERALRSDLGKYFESWLKNNINKDSTVFIYYAGHGAPGLKDDKAYLVPWDGDQNYPEKTCYPLDSLYASLGKLSAKEIIVAIDSCFSGAGGRSVVAEGTRPLVHISIENPMLASGNTVVITAATENQIASFYPDAKHGLFTYFFLKGLRGDGDLDGNGWVELKELFDYLKPEVTGIARRMNREQTPVILPSLEILGKRGAYRLTKSTGIVKETETPYRTPHSNP